MPTRRAGHARRPPSRPPRPGRGAAVEFEVRGGVAWITLARGGSRNRLEAEVMAGLVDACDAAEDAAAPVVVLRGEGPAFSAGLPRGCRWPEASWPDGVGAVGRLAKPVVAALHGDVLGWGLALALACDVRVAATSAVLALPELRGGTLPGGGAVQRLARMIGAARTLEMVLLGIRLTAARAAEWGLVSAVVGPARLPAAVEEVARRMAARGPEALRLAKEAVVKGLDLPLDDGIRLEQDLYVLLQTTEDRREGVRAFLERRTPRFRGR
jgi:enoyl-CoA hydratase/carnithine racemase